MFYDAGLATGGGVIIVAEWWGKDLRSDLLLLEFDWGSYEVELKGFKLDLELHHCHLGEAVELTEDGPIRIA